jgi:hypothetical protein
MKKIGILAGAYVVVALLAFLFGWFSQRGTINAANAATTACQESSVKTAEGLKANLGLLELYRARNEINRNNWGSAGDKLREAQGHLSGEAYATARADIDKANALVLKSEAASLDEIANTIKALEAKGLPAKP